MAMNGEMRMGYSANMEAQQQIQQLQKQMQISNALLELYQRQETFSLPNAAARSHLDAVITNAIQRPRFATVVSSLGEGGNGKSSMAAEWLARFMFNEEVVQRVYDGTGKLPKAHFISMPTVGQNMMHEFGADGMPLVKHIASEWDADDRSVIRNRIHTAVNISHRRLPEMDPEHVHFVVAEYVFGFTGNAMANPADHFAVYRMTNPKVQEVASRERDTYNKLDSKPAKAYKKEGYSLDDPEITAGELREYMGSRESIVRGGRMGDALIAEMMGAEFDANELKNARFRSSLLRRLFKLHMKEVGVRPGRGIILPNDFVDAEEGLDRDYHHKLVAACQLNSTALIAIR